MFAIVCMCRTHLWAKPEFKVSNNYLQSINFKFNIFTREIANLAGHGVTHVITQHSNYQESFYNF